MANRIDTHLSVEDFFETLLRDAVETVRVTLDGTEFAYVLKLVGGFSNAEALHRASERDDPGTPALVTLYQRARESAPSERFEAYRHLGDVALMVSGFFAPHIERARSLVGIDYYVQMGRTAYEAAATFSAARGFSQTLAQLSAKFDRLVDVLTVIAEKTTLPVARDLGSLYERYLRDPSRLDLSDRLLLQGAVPVFGVKGVAA